MIDWCWLVPTALVSAFAGACFMSWCASGPPDDDSQINMPVTPMPEELLKEARAKVERQIEELE